MLFRLTQRQRDAILAALHYCDPDNDGFQEIATDGFTNGETRVTAEELDELSELLQGPQPEDEQ
jgi:hypothetical protein